METNLIGRLGMGVRKEYRAQGIGKRLPGGCLSAAEGIGLEKVELEVFYDNVARHPGLGIGCVPWVGGVRTIRDRNGVEAGLISGERAFILSMLPTPFNLILRQPNCSVWRADDTGCD